MFFSPFSLSIFRALETIKIFRAIFFLENNHTKFQQNRNSFRQMILQVKFFKKNYKFLKLWRANKKVLINLSFFDIQKGTPAFK